MHRLGKLEGKQRGGGKGEGLAGKDALRYDWAVWGEKAVGESYSIEPTDFAGDDQAELTCHRRSASSAIRSASSGSAETL